MLAPQMIAAGCVITPDRELRPGWVETRGTRIARVGGGEPPRTADIESPTGIVVPGFIDSHVHGGGGASFSTAEPSEIETAVSAHLRHGTTTILASLVTAPTTSLLAQISCLTEQVEKGVLAGIHLEGPWLNPAYKGAHEAQSLTTPSRKRVDELLAAGRGCIRMVTLAPELEGGLEAVSMLQEHGVVVALGHTAADYDTVRAAIEAGVSVATHLYNAMPAMHHRKPGPVLAFLEDDSTAVELIFDGIHLHPRVAALAARWAADRFCLVTDAMAAAGAPDGAYHLGGLDVEVRNRRATLAGSSTIAGSTLTLDVAVNNAVRSGLPLVDAVRAATATPAARLGLAEVGSLRPHQRADLVVLTGELEIQRVMKNGRWVASRGGADQLSRRASL